MLSHTTRNERKSNLSTDFYDVTKAISTMRERQNTFFITKFSHLLLYFILLFILYCTFGTVELFLLMVSTKKVSFLNETFKTFE